MATDTTRGSTYGNTQWVSETDKVFGIVQDVVSELIAKSHGEATIRVTVRDKRVTFAEVTRTDKHKLD